MKKKIFRNTTMLVILAMLLTFFSVTIYMYQRISDCMQQEVKQEAGYLQTALDTLGTESLETGLVENIESRVTLVDSVGNVLYDSQADAATMDNHLSRPEIQDALSSGRGESIRYSDTFGKNSFYYAIRLENGEVIRVGNTVDSIYSMMFSGLAILIVALALVILISLYVINRTTNRLVAPVNELDLERPLVDVEYEELVPLLRRIDEQNGQLDQQMIEIRSQHEEYLAITENMKDGLIVTGLYKVLSINKAAQRVFNIDASECVGHDIITVHRNQALKEIVTGALEGRQMEKLIEVEGLTYQLLGNPVVVSGKITGAVIFVLDVTERQKLEVLRQEFSANVSHELKTPLMSISGYAEIMKNGMVKQEDIAEFSGRIYQEAHRLTELVEDIIRLSKLDNKDLELEQEEIDLMDMTQGMLESLKDSAAKKQVPLNCTGDAAKIQGMSQIVYEMLYNVCDNAINYNVEKGSVDVTISNTPQGVLWQVKDTGIGIAKDEQERIFERFYRVDKSHSRETGGTGLGLSIVKHGASLHNARVTLDSQPGEGTTIGILFPQ